MYKGLSFEEWMFKLQLSLPAIVEMVRQGVDLEKMYLQKIRLLSED